MSNVKRPYRSPRREQQAEETRRAIIDAAFAVFQERGYAGASIREVAERASVSQQTVYNAFGDKAGLLLGVAAGFPDTAAAREDAESVAALAAISDPLERIRRVARASREEWEGGALELELLVFDPHVQDPRLREVARLGLAQKHASTRAYAEILFPDDIRRPGVELEDIAAFATAFDSAASVVALRALGWDMDRWEAWMAELLTLFLDPAIERDPSPSKPKGRPGRPVSGPRR